MKKLTVLITLLVIILFPIASGNCQSINSSNSGNNVTQGYIPNSINQNGARLAQTSQQNCPGPSSVPYTPGMFQFDGDLEPFANSSHGVDCPSSPCTFCVSSDFSKTHALASLQDNACHNSLWKVSHGTPEIGINQNNHFMHIWSGDWESDGDFEGEGVFYDCELQACLTYQISLRLSSTALIKKINFYIASGLQHKIKDGNQWTPESSFYKVPSVTNAYLVHTITDFNSGSNNWINVTIPVFVVPDVGMKLWIFTEDDNKIKTTGVDLLFIDDVTDGFPGSSSTCTGNINYTVSPIPAFTKANLISASVATTLSSTEFAGGANIKLSPGFRTAVNSNFYAHIIPCTTVNNCPTGCVICRTSDGGAMVQKEEMVQIKDQYFYKLNLHPNPTNGELFIDKPMSEKVVSIHLIEESTGREVGFTNYEDLDTSIKFRVDHSVKGVFIFYLKTEKQTYAVRVVVN